MARDPDEALDRRDARGHALAEAPDEPPVVARLMVEIRSDGTRTVARGALEDLISGEKVALEARGASPIELAAKLTRSLLTAPLLARGAARQAVRLLLDRGSRRDRERRHPQLRQDDDD